MECVKNKMFAPTELQFSAPDEAVARKKQIIVFILAIVHAAAAEAASSIELISYFSSKTIIWKHF